MDATEYLELALAFDITDDVPLRKKKAAAESNRDRPKENFPEGHRYYPMGRDWEGHEDAYAAYGWIHNQLDAGIQVPRSAIQDGHWAFLNRMLPNGSLLAAQDGQGQIRVFSDPFADPRRLDEWGAPVPEPSYPGFPPGLDPALGARWHASETQEVTLRAIGATEGLRASSKMLAAWGNMHREQLDITHKTGLSSKMVKTALRVLYQDGKVVRGDSPRHFRLMHTWRTVPGRFRPASDADQLRSPAMNEFLEQAKLIKDFPLPY